MKKSIVLFILLQSLAFSTQAQWSGREKIKGNGNLVSKVVTIANYDRIQVSGIFDIILVKGDVGKITIEAEENLVNLIEIKVDNNELRIAQEKGKNIVPSRSMGIKITVPFNEMNRVSLSGSGSIKSKDKITEKNFSAELSGSGEIDLIINTAEATAKVTGSGDLTLQGDVESFGCSVTGSGDLDASALKSAQVNANVTGSIDCKVYCKEKIEARVTGSGDIIYFGDPARKDTKVTGSGDIRKG